MISRVFLILTLLLLSSCAGNVIISPLGCKTKGHWGKVIANNDFKFTEKVWNSFNDEHFYLKELLEENNLKCNEVGNLSIVVKKHWGDAFVSLIPFVSRYSIEISGKNIETVMDDLKAKGRPEL